MSRGGPELDIRLHYKRVTMCTVDEEYLGEFSTGGTDDGGLWWPSAIAIDSQDNIYIADEALQRVSVFTKRGKLLTNGAPKAPGTVNWTVLGDGIRCRR